MNIIFMGTPEFAVSSLEILIENGYKISAVVTAPDKPAGRGLHLNHSPVKISALKHGIPVLQPLKLKDPSFVEELQSYKPDLAIVVAFRMLPEIIWKMPLKGTFNLHASLLPQYRGAAPINRAIMNGETESGISSFFLQEEIDTGKIIFREKMSISPDETASQLHDRMKVSGAELVLKTVRAIESGEYTETSQSEFYHGEELKTAPKIFKEDCHIDWEESLDKIYNRIRGLSLYPAAWTSLQNGSGKEEIFKIYLAKEERFDHQMACRTIVSDNKTYLKIAVNGGFIHLLEVQMAGKKRMGIAQNLRGIKTSSLQIN
jgi:methionyl-tRNA formyltransferase